MLLSSHVSASARCFAGKVCGLVWSTWGTSLGEDKLGARDRTLNAKVGTHRANIPPMSTVQVTVAHLASFQTLHPRALQCPPPPPSLLGFLLVVMLMIKASPKLHPCCTKALPQPDSRLITV